MQYVIQVLAAILIGLSIGALLGPRQATRLIGSLIAIALGAITIFTANWVFLAAGTALFLLVMALPSATPART